MTHLKLTVCFATFSYGGNGGVSSECPQVGRWLARAIMAAKAEPRIGEVCDIDLCDTPITMNRNRAVKQARQMGADILVMVDSDQAPDMLLGHDPVAKPFFESSFEFLYKHWPKGPAVVCAPYCGPPPHENVYVFRWATFETGHPDMNCRLEQYRREEAAQFTGIWNVAAQPTGLILFDLRAFDLIDPPWFYYEYTDEFETEKASTEDVTCTRDISMHGIMKLGYNPLYCNWDAWAGHWKPKMVGKPTIIYVDEVTEKFAQAVRIGRKSTERLTKPSALQLGISTPAYDVDGLKNLVANCRAGIGPLQIVEVGSWTGTTSRAIAQVMGEGSHLWCIDTWEGSNGETFDVTRAVAIAYGSDKLFRLWEKNVGEVGYPERIFAVRGQSVEVAATWTLPVDFVFLDAEHSYEAVKADIEAWWPHLKVGGVFCGHDYGVKGFPGVKQAVDERFQNVGQVGNIWWIKKPAVAGGDNRGEALLAVHRSEASE